MLVCYKLDIRKHTIIVKRKDFELTKFNIHIIYLFTWETQHNCSLVKHIMHKDYIHKLLKFFFDYIPLGNTPLLFK